MATQTRESEIGEAFIGLIEGSPDEVVHGWFTTADIQLALFRRRDIMARPDEVRSVLQDFATGLQVDTYEPIRDRWALYDPNSVQSLSRLALAQSSAEEFSFEETDWLGQRFTRVVSGEDTRRPSYVKEEEEVVASLIDKGVLKWIGSDSLGSGVEWAGRLGEWCSMGGCGGDLFEPLPQSHGDFIPDADWGWRHGGVMYLSDSKLELQDKIRSVWAEHRRDGAPPTPNPAQFESVLALAIDFDVELVPSEISDWQ